MTSPHLPSLSLLHRLLSTKMLMRMVRVCSAFWMFPGPTLVGGVERVRDSVSLCMCGLEE